MGAHSSGCRVGSRIPQLLIGVSPSENGFYSV